MILNEEAIVCPAPRIGENPTIINLAKFMEAHAREAEVAIVNKQKAPELLATFNEAWRNLHDVVTKLEADKNKAQREASDRAARVTLEVAPELLKSRGLPCNSKTIDAVIDLDESYKSLCEVVDEIKCVQEFLKGRMKSFENSYNSVKKIMGEEAYSMQRRDQNLSITPGEADGAVGYQMTDKWCSVCSERQFVVSNGVTCKNSHINAGSITYSAKVSTDNGFGKAKF